MNDNNTPPSTENPQLNTSIGDTEASIPQSRKGLRRTAFLVPNLVTVIAIFCGFLSIVSTLRGEFEYAAKCIALAIILDGLDGRIARRLNACSAFGVEFDSLSDQVAFGVAPAVLIYQWALVTPAPEFGILISFLIVVCGAARLARFNVTSTTNNNLPSKSFQGLPIPGAAAALASLVYWAPVARQDIYSLSLIMTYSALIAFLMVSTISYPSIKHIKLTTIPQRKILALLAVAVAFTWYQTRLIIFIGSTLYALSGLLFLFCRKK